MSGFGAPFVGSDAVGSSQVRWITTSCSVYTARAVTMSTVGLKLRGSTMTWPTRGKAAPGCLAQNSAFGSSGTSPVTGEISCTDARPGRSGPSERT